MPFVLKTAANGVQYGQFSNFDEQFVRQAVSTSVGGISQQPFASLNLALHTGDDDAAVLANRQAFCLAVGIACDRLVTAQQTHGDVVFHVNGSHAGRGSTAWNDALPAVDALVTNVPDLPLMLFFADCVPILIWDAVRQAIGIVHAGWKGTAAAIVQKTLTAMERCFGTRPQDCRVGIGPSIGACCYQVDQQVADQFGRWAAGQPAILQVDGAKWRLDLWLANQAQLSEYGVPTAQIVTSGVCTCCNSSLFYSYRAQNGHTGRLAAVIRLKK